MQSAHDNPKPSCLPGEQAAIIWEEMVAHILSGKHEPAGRQTGILIIAVSEVFPSLMGWFCPEIVRQLKSGGRGRRMEYEKKRNMQKAAWASKKVYLKRSQDEADRLIMRNQKRHRTISFLEVHSFLVCF